jgi:hypothetical protein
MMRPYICFFSFILILCLSCSKVYDPSVDANQDALVVEGLITDQAAAYQIRLSKAIPYDSSGTSYVTHATVWVIDDNGVQYNFSESGNGIYASNPAELVGTPGKSYTLHIKTKDGNIYESSPQLLLPNDFTDNVYAEFATKEILVEDYYGGTSKQNIAGVDILVDIKNNTDSLSRFRFKSILTTELTYSVYVSPETTYYYYCWRTAGLDDLVNLTGEKYGTSSKDITKHTACFIPSYNTYSVYDTIHDTTVTAYVNNRILKLTRYTLNDETYQYYKNINTLLSAEGKLFDPIAAQFKGNISCISDPKKLALGLFEASAINTSTYYIHPGQKNVVGIPNMTVPSSDCKINTVPDFWIY